MRGESILHRDEHLLAVAKPAGVNTHRPAPEAQEGVFEWLQGREGKLALHHRLDKETSGVLLLARTPEGSKHLTRAFEGHDVKKRYVFLTGHKERPKEQRCDERVAKPRAGRAALDPEGALAHTDFTVLEEQGDWDLVEARPRTGRTHQIRLHAARLDMPILGDRLYGGAAAARLFLHARSLDLTAVGGAPLSLEARLPHSFELVGRARPTDLSVSVVAALESRSLVRDETDAFVWLDGAQDGLRDLRVERLGDAALVYRTEDTNLPAALPELLLENGARAVVERLRARRPGEEKTTEVRVLAGDLGSPRFDVLEHGLRYGIDLEESVTSTGLFLDQRDTRRRILAMDLRGKEVLNAFAHTGSFSVAAARAGARTTSLDLSKKYLERVKENLSRNSLDPAGHDFIYGDALEWLRRLAKKGRRFSLVVLDPPSFSTAKKGKTWSVERDLGKLVALALACLEKEGTLYVSTNQRSLPFARFEKLVQAGFAEAGRKIQHLELATLPLDFRLAPGEVPYLKAAWAG